METLFVVRKNRTEYIDVFDNIEHAMLQVYISQMFALSNEMGLKDTDTFDVIAVAIPVEGGEE